MSELDEFKRNINLSAFAASRGYAIDPRETSRGSAVMRHPNGDKVIIARNESGIWIYFSVRDDRDNGTIVDFVQFREGGSLGEVRKTLRAWRGSSGHAAPVLSFARELIPISHDRAKVALQWEQAHFRAGSEYLNGRGIGPSVLMSPRFARCWREDARGNVLFPHYDKIGLCGFEIKNWDFTGFCAGGIKGLWFSKSFPSDNCLVVSESAIDGISFNILNPDSSARYMSTGGSLNPQQPGLLRGAFEKLAPGSLVIFAFDDDEAGDKMAKELEGVIPSGLRYLRGRPPAKDWNQALKDRLGLK